MVENARNHHLYIMSNLNLCTICDNCFWQCDNVSKIVFMFLQKTLPGHTLHSPLPNQLPLPLPPDLRLEPDTNLPPCLNHTFLCCDKMSLIHWYWLYYCQVRVNDRIVWLSDSGPEFGFVRWLGHLPGSRDGFIAGVEFVSWGVGKNHEHLCLINKYKSFK